MTPRSIVLLALFIAGTAHAETGVLVEHVPGGAPRESVLRIVKAALVRHHWKVGAIDDTSVSASIVGTKTNADLQISLSDGQLLYDGVALQLKPTTPSQPGTKRPVRFPKRWLRNLQVDIDHSLAPLPDRP